MGASKTDHYTHFQNNIAIVSKAMGHPARIAILEFLLTKNNSICEDIVKNLPLAQPTVSQHLKELKSAGLIEGNIKGNTICYAIVNSEVAKFREYIHNLHSKINLGSLNQHPSA